MDRKHILHACEECHDQAHTLIRECAISLVKMVPPTQPSEPQLEQIAEKIVKWEGLATHLGINKQERFAIKENEKEYERQKVVVQVEATKWKPGHMEGACQDQSQSWR